MDESQRMTDSSSDGDDSYENVFAVEIPPERRRSLYLGKHYLG